MYSPSSKVGQQTLSHLHHQLEEQFSGCEAQTGNTFIFRVVWQKYKVCASKHAVLSCSADHVTFQQQNIMKVITSKKYVGMEPPACSLCQGHHPITSTPSQWKDEAAFRYIMSINVADDGVVCKACRQDIKRVLDNPSHTPRWQHTRVQESTCSIDGCSKTVFSSLQRSATEIDTALQHLQLKTTTLVPPTALCKHHYHAVYHSIEPTQRHCVTCGTPLRRQSNTKVCPQPQLIQKHLQDNTGFEGTIRAQEKVCFTCYKSHLFIINEQRTVSRDTDLEHLISHLRQGSEVVPIAESTEAIIQSSINQVTVEVAEELLRGNALLLLDCHSKFCSIASALPHEDIHIAKLVILQPLSSTI
jgi:hypothetical protein